MSNPDHLPNYHITNKTNKKPKMQSLQIKAFHDVQMTSSQEILTNLISSKISIK